MYSNPGVEVWTLYGLGILFTIIRTYARLSAVGLRNLRADDYLIWLAVLIYTAQCTLTHKLDVVAHGLANNGMTDYQRSTLAHNDPEYARRVIGSKFQVAGWTASTFLLWTLKLCVTFFYLRLTDGLETYQKRIHVAMALIVGTFIAIIMTNFLSCRPFHHYWQIDPDPGNSCQAAVSKPILWVSFVSNVSTDAFLFLIPVPMLWKSSLRLSSKIAATLVLSAGLLIIICAILKSIHVIVDPVRGGQLAAAWGTRETFIAFVTTNLPMIFPLIKAWLAPFLPKLFRSSSDDDAYKSPGSGFVTIGGGGALSHHRQGPRSACHVTANMSLDNESEEHIFKGHDDLKMHQLHKTAGAQQSLNAIVVSKQVSITTEDFNSERSTDSFHQV